MAKTPNSIVAVERVSSVVKGEPPQDPGEVYLLKKCINNLILLLCYYCFLTFVNTERPVSLECFEMLKKIGQGGYGEV